MIIDNIENKRKILAKFLEICVFEKISEETLEKSLKACEIDAKFKNLIFENGVLSLIEFYISENNRQIAKIIEQKPDFAALKIREKIKFALYTLFETIKPHKDALSNIYSFFLDIRNFSNSEYGPRPLALGFKNAFVIADFIWFEIGDKSTDYNFYTKRLTLAKIIIKSFFVFLQDSDKDLKKTKNFIDLEIEKVMKFEKFKAKAKAFCGDLQEKSREIFVDENGEIKSLKKIVKDLPFIRLF